MPALPAVPGVVKIVNHIQVGIDTTTSWHTYYGYGSIPPTQAQATALANAAQVSYAQHISPLCVPTITLLEVTATDLASSSSPIGVNTTTSNGTRVGGLLPGSTAMLVSWKINRRYRGGKPRIYVPCGADADLANEQEWTQTFLTEFTTAHQAYVAAILANIGTWGTSSLVNVSYYHGHTWYPPDSTPSKKIPTLREVPVVDTITGGGPQKTLGSQRRRVRGRT